MLCVHFQNIKSFRYYQFSSWDNNPLILYFSHFFSTYYHFPGRINKRNILSYTKHNKTKQESLVLKGAVLDIIQAFEFSPLASKEGGLLLPSLVYILPIDMFRFSRYIESILPKGPYLPCVSMAGRALLAGYHQHVGQLLAEEKDHVEM